MVVIIYILIHLQPDYYSKLHLPPMLHWLENEPRGLEFFRSGGSRAAAAAAAPYRLEVYRSKSNDYMLVLYPQALHFFIENKRLLYHGKNVKNEYYDCPADYQLAYTINIGSSKVPKFICHKNIHYLKKYVYIDKVYTKPYHTLQNPLSMINNFFITIQKLEGMRMMMMSVS